MAEPPLTVAHPSAYFGAILAASRAHATTAEVWTAIRSQAAAAGYRFPADIFSQVNAMRSAAVGIIRASEALASADPSQAIGPQFLAQAPWGRSPEAQAAFPIVQARYQMTTVGPGGEETGWYRWEMPGGLDGWTVGEVQDAIAAYAADAASDYSTAFVSLDTIDLLAV